MTPSAAPDPARARLRGLGPAVRGAPVPTEPQRPAPVAPRPRERVGWPTAAPGTPAARLRFSDPPAWSDGGAADDAVDGDPVPDGRLPRVPGAAWDAVEHQRERWAQRWLPASWQGARWDPGRTGALALAVVTALAAVAAAVGVWRDRPVAEPVPSLPAITTGAQAVPGGLPALDARPAPRGGPIVVSVTGRVGRPGLVRLTEGARVGDALAAAGGAARGVDLTGLNLAQRLADGEQVVVGVRAPVGGAPGGAVTGAAAPGGRAGAGGGAGGAPAGGGALDLNAATLEQLDQLPGVGPVTAQKILDWRTENGRFAAIEQLQEVGGIGEARFAQLRTRVRV